MQLPRLNAVETFFRSVGPTVMLYARGGPRVEPLPDWRARPYRVLFIRDDGIGDLIVSMETMRSIREASATISLDMLASPANAAFARTLPFIDQVIVHRRSGGYRQLVATCRRLRREGYDVVIDGRVAVSLVNTHTAALLLSSGARWRVGLGGRRNDRVYTVRVHRDAASNNVETIAALATPFGVQLHERDWRPRLQVPADDRVAAERMWATIGSGRPRVLVNISVGNDERVWKHERYADVLARLRERCPRAAIAIAAMPADQHVAEDLAVPVGAVARQLSFSEVMAAVDTADLVVTPDTAISHVAAALQIPSLVLMRRDTNAWAPYRAPGRVVFGDTKKKLEPGLPTERVVAALDAVIDDFDARLGWGNRP